MCLDSLNVLVLMSYKPQDNEFCLLMSIHMHHALTKGLVIFYPHVIRVILTFLCSICETFTIHLITFTIKNKKFIEKKE